MSQSLAAHGHAEVASPVVVKGGEFGCHTPYEPLWAPSEPADLSGCDCFGHSAEELLRQTTPLAPPTPPAALLPQSPQAFFHPTPQFYNPLSVVTPPAYQLVNSLPWHSNVYQSEAVVEWKGVRGAAEMDDDVGSKYELSTIESECECDSECGESQTLRVTEEEEAGVHPCIRVWGQCKYGEECIFATLPREYCVFCLRRAPHKKCDGLMPEPEDLPELSKDVMDKVADHAHERKKNQQARRAKRRAAKRKEQKAAAREKKEAEALIYGH